VVTLTKEVMATMQAHAEQTFPEECVGVLFSDGTTQPLHNTAVDRRRGFLVSARETLAVERTAASRGLRVSAFYHSHPDGLPLPSREDAAHAQPGSVTIILSVTAGVAAAPRVFLFDDERFSEVKS
jgi:desampylase